MAIAAFGSKRFINSKYRSIPLRFRMAILAGHFLVSSLQGESGMTVMIKLIRLPAIGTVAAAAIGHTHGLSAHQSSVLKLPLVHILMAALAVACQSLNLQTLPGGADGDRLMAVAAGDLRMAVAQLETGLVVVKTDPAPAFHRVTALASFRLLVFIHLTEVWIFMTILAGGAAEGKAVDLQHRARGAFLARSPGMTGDAGDGLMGAQQGIIGLLMFFQREA